MAIPSLLSPPHKMRDGLTKQHIIISSLSDLALRSSRSKATSRKDVSWVVPGCCTLHYLGSDHMPIHSTSRHCGINTARSHQTTKYFTVSTIYVACAQKLSEKFNIYVRYFQKLNLFPRAIRSSHFVFILHSFLFIRIETRKAHQCLAITYISLVQ